MSNGLAGPTSIELSSRQLGLVSPDDIMVLDGIAEGGGWGLGAIPAGTNEERG